MKKMRKALVVIVAVVIALTAVPTTAEASTKNATLNKTSVTLKMTDKKPNPTVTLKVKNTSVVSAKWASSNKKVATVKNGKVTAKKAGKATITCKVTSGWGAKKTLKCKVVVKDKRTPVNKAASKKMKVTLVKATNASETNHLKVTYNGNDVTNKVTYKVTKNYGFAFVNKKSIIEVGGNDEYNGYFDVEVTYKVKNKVAKKTIKLRYKGRKEVWYMECNCGWSVYGKSYAEVDDKLIKHNEPWETNPWLAYDPKYANCTGYWSRNEHFDNIVQVK